MKRVTDALPDGLLSGAARLGINRQRVARGERPLAREHLPFNRRRPAYGPREIDQITASARHAGLDRQQQHELRRHLWEMRRREAASLEEEFMLHFNAAYDVARDRIWEASRRLDDEGRPLLRSPRTAIDVYNTICQACGRLSAESELTRAELAKRCRLSERQVSRQTRQLEQLDLLRTGQDGKGVKYVVLPVAEHGYPLWHGDRIAMLDAAAEVRERRDRERQMALV